MCQVFSYFLFIFVTKEPIIINWAYKNLCVTNHVINYDYTTIISFTQNDLDILFAICYPFSWEDNLTFIIQREVQMSEEEKGIIKKLFKATKEVIYGMASHDTVRYALKTRASMEHLFILITMGDLLGVPILPPYYSLRLLPYVVPQISTWKRRMLREKDLTDALA
jgi:hypothetical protein